MKFIPKLAEVNASQSMMMRTILRDAEYLYQFTRYLWLTVEYTHAGYTTVVQPLVGTSLKCANECTCVHICSHFLLAFNLTLNLCIY